MQTGRSVRSLAGSVAVAISLAGAPSCARNEPLGFEDAGGDASGGEGRYGGGDDAAGFGGGGSGSGGFGGASSGSGGASGSSGGGSGAGSDGGGAPGTCAPTASPGAVALTSNYLAASILGAGGYAYAYEDAMGSAACLASSAFCGAGSTVTANATGTAWGAGIGVSLNQAMATGPSSPPVEPYAVPASATGIAYTLSAMPAQGARLIIDDHGTDYCARLSAASASVPWASFNTACWNGSGTSLAGAPQQATHVQLQITAGSAPAPFDVCVTAIGFAP